MRNVVRPRAGLFSFLLLLAWLGSAFRAHAETYSFAVVPQFPVVEVFRTWRPLLDALEAETGHKFELKTSESIPKFEASFMGGEPDFVYMNPYHAVMARGAAGYVPLVRSKEPLSGILVVRSDSTMHDITELRGRTIAYPSPNAFGASLYMRALLGERFKIATEPVYVQTHVNAYRAVIRGDHVAAGGIRSTLEREPSEVRDKLRVMYETPATSSHPVMAHPRMSTATRNAVRAAFMKVAKTEAGGKLLDAVSLHGLVEADYGKDYAPLEGLRLERFVVQPK
nr:phosphate/phosphite/phosphonate ABC transporter substrate-binding protein [uncultured Rhodoferax sp.]